MIIYDGKGPDWQMGDTSGKEFFPTRVFLEPCECIFIHDYLNIVIIISAILLCCSVAKSCPALCDPMNYSTPGFPVLHYLLKFVQTHVH